MRKIDNLNNLNRRDFLGAGVGALGFSALPAFADKPFNVQTSKNKQKPNFLFLHTDQQHADYFSGLGYPHVKTPQQDQLLQEGMLFRNAYAPNPVCGPCRSSWFTGRHSSETGCINNRFPITNAEKFPDMGQWFGRAGYETMHCGKWHFNGRDRYKSFDYIPTVTHWGEHADISCARVMSGFLASRRDDKPFFASVGLVNPHDIGNFRASVIDQREEEIDPNLIKQFPEVPDNFYKIPEGEPRAIVKFQREGILKHWKELNWRYYIWAYHRYTEMIDEVIGFIFQALKSSKYHENTYVIFTSDHGDGAGHHQTYGKPFFYDQTARVPFVVYHPTEVPAGAQSDALVNLLDIYPTICDYMGVLPPERLQGKSIRPIVEGKTKRVSDYVYAQSNPNGHMIRSDRYKYVEYKGDPKTQLFDMKADPMETKNLAVGDNYAKVIQEHQVLLAEAESSLAKNPLHPRAKNMLRRK